MTAVAVLSCLYMTRELRASLWISCECCCCRYIPFDDQLMPPSLPIVRLEKAITFMQVAHNRLIKLSFDQIKLSLCFTTA